MKLVVTIAMITKRTQVIYTVMQESRIKYASVEKKNTLKTN
jgi:hypothetical protein